MAMQNRNIQSILPLRIPEENHCRCDDANRKAQYEPHDGDGHHDSIAQATSNATAITPAVNPSMNHMAAIIASAMPRG